MQEKEVTERLRVLWSSFMNSRVLENPQERSKNLECFMVEFLDAYHTAKGELKKISDFGDINSVSNVVTGEFQDVILLRCKDDNEQSLVHYLCQGSGLLMLQTLCILASKIVGCSLEFNLANLLVSLLAVVLKVPLQDYDALYGLEIVFGDFENYYYNSKSTSHHANLAKVMIQDLCVKECHKQDAPKEIIACEEQSNLANANDECDILEFSSLTKGVATKNCNSENDMVESLSSVTDIESTNVKESDCSDAVVCCIDATMERCNGDSIQPITDVLPICDPGIEDKDHDIQLSGLSIVKEGQVCINNFQLALLLVSILENLTCHGIHSIHNPEILMHASGKLIEILQILRNPNPRNTEVVCSWESGSLTAIQLVILRTIFAIIYTMSSDAKAAKQLSKSSYIGNLGEIVSDGFVDKDFMSAQLHFKLAKVITTANFQRKILKSNLPSHLWKAFQHELFQCCSLHGFVLFVTCCLHHGTVVNSSLFVLCQGILDQFSAKGLFECAKILLLKLDDIHPHERNADSTVINTDGQNVSFGGKIEHYPKYMSKRIIRSLGKMISVLKKGRSCCKKSRELNNRKNSVVNSERLVIQEDILAVCGTYLRSSEVEESSESAADMEFESERQDQFSDDVCAVFKPAVTLLTVFKESKNAEFRLNLLSCLERVGICHCISPQILVTSLLNKFIEQPKDVQSATLRVMNMLVLSEIDVVDDCVDVLPSQFSNSRRLQGYRCKAFRRSPGRSDSGFSASDVNIGGLGVKPGDSNKDERQNWTCLSQYCMLLSTKDTSVAVQVMKSLRALAILGTTYLREELFRMVVLPCILRGDRVFTEDVAEPLKKIRQRSMNGRNSLEWQQQGRSFGGSRTNSDNGFLFSEANVAEDNLCKEVLELCICSLPSLLRSSASRKLFFNCGGLNEIEYFLSLPDLQQPVLRVLEFLAGVENREDSRRVVPADKTVFTAGSPETSSEEKTDSSKVCCQNFLSLLEFTTSFVKENNDSDQIPHREALSASCHPVESSLRVHMWKSCLHLLVSNELFCELFLKGNGEVFSYDLLRHLIDFFQEPHSDGAQNDDLLSVKDLVSLFESVLPICLRLAHTDHWKNREALPSIEQLVEKAKKALTKSDTLRRFISKGFCDCFLMASMCEIEGTSDTTELNYIDIRQQRNEVLRKACTSDIHEEWAYPVEDDDDDDDNEGNDNQKVDSSVFEEGYDADQEGDSDRSDKAEHRTAKNKRQPKDRRKNENSAGHDQISRGLVIYPQIYSILLQLLKVCFDGRPLQDAEPDNLSIVLHAVESLLRLLRDREEHCRTLSEEGFIGSLLECFHDAMRTQNEALKDLQRLVADVFVCLARHSIRADELWDFLTLFNSADPPVQLLSAALSKVAEKSSLNPGPAYVLSFPCSVKGVGRNTSNVSSTKWVSGKWTQAKGKKSPKIKLPPPQQSEHGSSSEGEVLQAGSMPSRFAFSESLEKNTKRVQRKPRSMIDGGKRRATVKRSARKSSGSVSLSGNSVDNDSIEMMHYEGHSQLPSPFSLWGVHLPFHGSLPRSDRGFSLALWICLTCPKIESEYGVGRRNAYGDLSGTFAGESEVMGFLRQERIVHLCSIGSGKSLFEVWIVPTDGLLVVRWTKNHKRVSSNVVVLKERVIKLAALTRRQWHHLVISCRQVKPSTETKSEENLQSSELLVVVDGTEKTTYDFGPPHPWQEEAKFTLSTLSVGHVISWNASKSSNTKMSLHCGYEMGNVFVFTENPAKRSKQLRSASTVSTEWLLDQEEAFYLYSLGPNSASLGQLSKDFYLVTQTANDSTQPFLEAVRLWSRMAITEQAVAAQLAPGLLTSPHVVLPDLEESLKKKLAAVYSPAFPLIFQQYAELLTSEDRQGKGASAAEQRVGPRENESREIITKIASEVRPQRQHTLLESAHDVGGISVFIYLFAKVVELTRDEKTQADALSVVLSLQYFSSFHARAMAEESGFALLKRILLSRECKIGYHTLKVLMEAACDGDVFRPTNLAEDPVMLNIDSTAVVRNVAIFQHFLLNWKIWEKAKQGVLEMLLATIDILVHGSHCYYEFNIIQFQKAQLVQQILIGCQERQSEDCKEIPRVISSLYVNIIQNVMGNPPDLTVLKAVCEFLVAVHPADDVQRLHAPNRCYLREHSLDIGPKSNHPSSAKRGSVSTPSPRTASPRTAPVRPVHSNPFQFPSPLKSHSKGALSRSLSVESFRKQDESQKLGYAQNLLRHERFTTISTSCSGGEVLSRSFPAVVNPGYAALSLSQGTLSGQASRANEEKSALELNRSTEDRNDSNEGFSKKGFSTTSTGRRDLTITIPNRKRAERLSSSELALHEFHFSENDSQKTSSPVPSPGTPLGSSYPSTYSIPGTKPMVITRHGSSRSNSRGEQSSVDLREYDLINSSDFSSLRGSVVHPSSAEDFLVVEGFPGIQSSTLTYCPNRSDSSSQRPDVMIKLRLGLMKLLEMKLFNLPTEHVPAVIGEVLKAEYMLVWAYHDSDDVRVFAIKILFQYLQKAEPKRHEQFLRIHGFHLLANQLYDHSVTKLLIEGCLSLLVDRPVDLNKDFDYSNPDDRDLASSVRPMGVVPLLALLENSLLRPTLFHLLIQHLCQLFIKVDDLCLQAVGHGLLETVCNVIYGLSILQDGQSQEESSSGISSLNSIIEDVQQFVVCIVRKACSTNGNMYFQMFEDLLIALEHLEEEDHKNRDHNLSTQYSARFFRFLALQVALHFFQEVSKGEVVVGKKAKPSGLRLPFRASDNNADPVPSFTPVSRWVNLDRDKFKSCLDPSHLRKTPTSANSNEQTRRFQATCQLAVNSIVNCKTFFPPADFVAYHSFSTCLDVNDALRPGLVKGTGAAVKMEFAQFVFSLLLEILDACLDGRKREIYKLFIVSKDSLKAQFGKLMVFLLNSSDDLDLPCFALRLAYHSRAKKIIESVLTTGGGTKLRERVAVYLLKILAHPELTQQQRRTGEMFKEIMLSLNLQSMRLNSGDIAMPNDDEMQPWDTTDKASMMQWQKQRSDAFRRLEKRTEELTKAISTVAKDVTRVVVEIQDIKRQALLKHSRDALSAEVQVRKKWRQLIERLIHERSVWFDAKHFPSYWRLDPTEGQGRVRCRLQRFHLDVDEKYLMEEYRGKKSKGLTTPLSYLFEDTTISSKKNVYYIFDTPDTIRFLYHCKNITLDSKIKGVLLIGESHMYFVGEEAIADTDITQILLGNKDAISISWSYEEIQEIRTRRYCLQDNGLEIFLTTGRTYLLAFDSKEDREIVLDQFKKRSLPCYEAPQYDHLVDLTNRWRLNQMTNFQYLTELNKMAGRSFNDLMQYPVFPFVLADFGHEVLDLNDLKTFRDLSRPIAVQNQSKDRKYREKFKWLQEEYERLPEKDPMTAPYHYGCHYSNSGTVLHFLVRLPPFTKIFLHYQDRSFDIPDRTFHSMETTWRLSSFESATDVKELIPEFFFLPEFLENNEGFDFGIRQNGSRVMNVELPHWAKGSTRLFIFIHRQALESDYVSKHLNQWIDLVFGYKQTGREAEDAINVFHPATYYGVDVNAITDHVRQKALKTMIETYGQTPQQLFNFPHSPRPPHKQQITQPSDVGSMTSLNAPKFLEIDAAFVGYFNQYGRLTTSLTSETGTVASSSTGTISELPSPMSTVEGLKWGQYVGSPALGAPAVGFTQPLPLSVQSLLCLDNDSVFALSDNSTLMTVHQEKSGEGKVQLVWSAALSWGYMDGSLRMRTSPESTPICLLEHHTPDKITCCAVTDGCKWLFIGTSTGTLSVLPAKYSPFKEPNIEVLDSRVRLHGHKDAITCIEVCKAFSIVVSGSCDSTAIIWDLNRLNYVRYLEHSNTVAAASISRTTGDIATVSHSVNCISVESTIEEGSVMKLWTVNGRFIGDVTCEHMINCLEFSSAPEGISVNVIATGLSNGSIRLWSTWDLRHIRDIAPDLHLQQVSSLTFSDDSQRLFAINTQGKLVVWQRRDKVYTKAPIITVFQRG